MHLTFFTIIFTLNPIHLLGTEYSFYLYETKESLVSTSLFNKRL